MNERGEAIARYNSYRNGRQDLGGNTRSEEHKEGNEPAHDGKKIARVLNTHQRQSG